jgi:hypothetical protein
MSAANVRVETSAARLHTICIDRETKHYHTEMKDGRERITLTSRTEDAGEGIRALFEKRDAVRKGR